MIQGIVCVQVKYTELRLGEGLPFFTPGPVKTHEFIISSNVLRDSSLQKIVCEMCARLAWLPVVYRRIEDYQYRTDSGRVLAALS